MKTCVFNTPRFVVVKDSLDFSDFTWRLQKKFYKQQTESIVDLINILGELRSLDLISLKSTVMRVLTVLLAVDAHESLNSLMYLDEIGHLNWERDSLSALVEDLQWSLHKHEVILEAFNAFG